MHTVGTWDPEFTSTTTIYFNKTLSFNAKLILQEIMDDFWAAWLCFQNGFTKKSQSILRSILELLVQLYYLKSSYEQNALATNEWVLRNRGVQRFSQGVAVMKKIGELKNTHLPARLNALYNRLSTSTHSRKDRLAVTNSYRHEIAGDTFTFEPFEILYTAALFWSTIDSAVRLIQKHFEKEPETNWIPKLRQVFSEIESQLHAVRTIIENFDKGYLIHREYLVLSDPRPILYSLDLNNRLEFPSRKKRKFSEDQAEEFRNKLHLRLLQRHEPINLPKYS
jgi:hypothetical protein